MPLLISCAPVFEQASMPVSLDEAVIQEVIESNKVLILPVWRKAPFFANQIKPDTYFIDKSLIDAGRNVSSCYRNLPRPLNYGLVGPASQLGSEVTFEGLYIIADNGVIIWLQYNLTPSKPSWSLIKMAYLGNEWKEILEKSIRSNTIELQPNHDKEIWGAYNRGINKTLLISIKLKEHEKSDILMFLSQVYISENSLSLWKIIKKKA